MTVEEWIGILAALTAIATGFLAALRWMVRQFVQEIGNQLTLRMDHLEVEIGVLSSRQSDIYATIIQGGVHGKGNQGAKGRTTPRKRTKRQAR
jgi:hypothetical protein